MSEGSEGPVSPDAGTGEDLIVEVHILSGTRTGDRVALLSPERVRLGRDPGAEVAFPRNGDVIVSHRHAELRREGGGYVLYDVGSTNGVISLPGGERVTRLPLPPRCEVELGPGGPRCRITISPAPSEAVPFGKYLLTGRLGQGGMAEVYLARQQGLGGFDRQVVLKLIRPELYEVASVSAMLLDEARIVAEISHPNVVQVLDVGEERGVLYLAMEYLRGVTLFQLLSEARRGAAPPPDLWAALCAQVCAGLHAAHELRDASGRPRHVVHRDVSPSNLMVSPEGVVKIIDFGVARAEGRLARTNVGQIKGKLAYMAPEQLRGEAVDRRVDIFSVGVVLYELCSGQRLFHRDNDLATVAAVTQGAVAPLRGVCPQAPPLLDQVVMAALAPDPQARPQTAAELGAALQRVVAEAGGRFASGVQIAHALAERGVTLHGRPPRPIGAGLPRWREVVTPMAPPPAPPPTTEDATQLDLVPAAAPPDAPESGPVSMPPGPAPAPAPAPGSVIEPPPAGEVMTWRTLAGGEVRLRALWLRQGQDRDPVPLPLCGAPGLLPAPLLVSLGVGSLIIELDRAAGAGRQAAAIYLDAHAPSTRRESYLIAASLRDAGFDVGHRRARVQRVRVESAVCDGAPGPLRLDAPLLEATLQVPEASLLSVLCTTEPGLREEGRGDIIHALCVIVT